MRVRPIARPGEIDCCAELMATSEPWLTLRRSARACRRVLANPHRELYIGEHSEQIAGFILLDMAGALAGYIQTVCIRPELRGRGLGSQLIRWAENRILRESPNVFLCVSSFNPSARRLYERLGYVVVGELTDYLAPGYSEILMRKSVGAWSEFKTGS